jgi:membrane protease YdiL (CAAX protease family)
MLLTLVVALIGVVVLYVAAQAVGIDVDGAKTPPGITIGGTVIQDLALIGSALFFARLSGGVPTPAQFGVRIPRLGPAVGWTFAAWASFMVFSLVWSLALGINESDNLPEELGADKSTTALIAVMVLVTLLAPLCEEFFFRGFCFTALRRWLGLGPAAVITGVIFGAIHAGGTNVEFLVPLAFFGIVLCLLYWVTGSLLPCIVLHALNNSLALGVSLHWGVAGTVAAMIGSSAVCVAITLPLARGVRAEART